MTRLEFLKLEIVRLQDEIAVERAAEFKALEEKFKFKKSFEFEESDGIRDFNSQFTVFSQTEISDDLTLSDLWELEDKEGFFVWS